MTKRNEHREVWSFFSGAMGLDLGMEQAGLPATLAIECDPDCRATIKANRPNLLLPEFPVDKPGDISAISSKDLRQLSGHDGQVFLMVGGPPCQSFSTGGKRAALSDPRGNLIYAYLRLIKQIRPKYFVLENVANLVTAAINHRPIKDRPGQQWNLKKYNDQKLQVDDGNAPLTKDEMSGSAINQILKDVHKLGYRVSFAILNSAEFGAPQKRLRFVMIGSTEEYVVPMPTPTHSEDPNDNQEPYVTLRDATWDLRDSPGPHSVYTDKVRAFFENIPPGGNWRNLPLEMQKDALGGSFEAGGGKTGFYRRLHWDRPTPTITGRANRKGSAICHPSDVRPLSVRECARVQGFPDNWEFTGAMSSQYQQIGNAVPTQLGRAVADAILRQDEEQKKWPELPLDYQLEVAVTTLRASARNNKKPRRKVLEKQMPLF